MIDEELEELEASLDEVPKKSRQTPTISLDEIAETVSREAGPIVLNDRGQPNINIKKLFCFVAMELGHYPREVGERCGIDRTSAIHHWHSMKQVIELAGLAVKMTK